VNSPKFVLLCLIWLNYWYDNDFYQGCIARILYLMPRILCKNCQRPSNACICHFIISTSNSIPVIVLQHPSEVKQTKGTVALLSKSLASCQVIIGEDFSKNKPLEKIMASHQALLLYPSEQSSEIKFSQYYQQDSAAQQSGKPLCLIIIDGTWKKAYRIFMLSKKLQQLPHVCLPQILAENGQYVIRKVSKKNALSSLEATCYGLAILEDEYKEENSNLHNFGIYQPLLEKFVAFNQFQLSFTYLSAQK